MSELDFQVPDLVKEFEGWRWWRIEPDGIGRPRLGSVSYSYHWKPRLKAAASCLSCGASLPRLNCTCGFYTARSLEHLLGLGYRAQGENPDVLGQVANWGKIVECDQGWRSQFAYPVQLWVPARAWRWVKPLTEEYGVPVRLLRDLDLDAKWRAELDDWMRR